MFYFNLFMAGFPVFAEYALKRLAVARDHAANSFCIPESRTIRQRAHLAAFAARVQAGVVRLGLGCCAVGASHAWRSENKSPVNHSANSTSISGTFPPAR